MILYVRRQVTAICFYRRLQGCLCNFRNNSWNKQIFWQDWTIRRRRRDYYRLCNLTLFILLILYRRSEVIILFKSYEEDKKSHRVHVGDRNGADCRYIPA